MAKIRAFIALTIPESPLLRKLHARLSKVGHGIRPVSLDGLHVTLKFLGDTEEGLISEITTVMKRVAAREAVVEVRLTGLGVFPNLQRPSVVWVGMRNAELLARLAGGLDAELVPLGFVPESRPFQPHLTVLRLKSRPPDPLFDLLEEAAETDFGAVRVEEIELFRSELRPDGSRYTRLATARLGGA